MADVLLIVCNVCQSCLLNLFVRLVSGVKGVGKCDSERQSTRAFWWTNSSARRRMKRFIKDQQAEDTKDDIENPYDDDDDDDDDDNVDDNDGEASETDNSSNSNNSNRDEGPINRRRSVLISRNKTRWRRGLVNPIYGIGVVFYLDHYGRIQGIMTWGLPFADRPGESLNPDLLELIKHLIATNAGVSALDAEENHQLMNLALGKASQKLVALAVKGHVSDMTRAWHGLDGRIEGFSTPLYRYTEVSNSRSKTLNVLKRKNGSGLGVLGEGLYVRDDFIADEALEDGSSDNSTTSTDEEAEKEDPPSNIPTTMYPVTVPRTTNFEEGISVDTAKELNRFLEVQRWWETNENRARPGKEDPIWLRPGDEKKNTSGKQNVIDAFRKIMFPHRSG